MKRGLIYCALWAFCCLMMFAQDKTHHLTLFRDYKPATILMTSGKVVKAPLANIFLKNASLLYKRGTETMEAYMKTIKSAQVGDMWFVNIDDKMAQLVDSVGANRLYCITEIDMEAYEAHLRNNVNITTNNFSDLVSGSDQISYSTVELERPEDQQLPLIRRYYFLYNGQLVKAHEREISRKLPKDKKHIYKTILSLQEFSWLDPDSLLMMLKAISEKSE